MKPYVGRFLLAASPRYFSIRYPNVSIATDIGRYGTHSTQTAIYYDRFSENLVVIGPVDSTCILYCTYFLLNKLKTTEVKIRCHTFLANRCAMRARRFYVVPSTKPITTNKRSFGNVPPRSKWQYKCKFAKTVTPAPLAYHPILYSHRSVICYDRS